MRFTPKSRDGLAAMEVIMIVALASVIGLALVKFWNESGATTSKRSVYAALGEDQERAGGEPFTLPDANSVDSDSRDDVKSGDDETSEKKAFGQPGVYVVARDLAGAAFVGTHQFIVLVPKDQTTRGTIDLGNGVRGVVLGAHNIDGRLQTQFGEASDVQATKEFANPDEYVKWWKADFDTEVQQVDLGGRDVDQTIRQILQANSAYDRNESRSNIEYPRFDQQFYGDNPNSNSWAQSIIDHTVGPGAVPQDFFGLDAQHEDRIDSSYFE